jgi:hypothetical protein
MIYNVVFWLNSFPSQNGILGTHSPRKIVTDQDINYKAHCILEFGSYVQVHEEHSNNMDSRTTGAISLRPTGNSQGGHYFYSLTSGRRLNRNRWTLLPMPMEVIDRVHQMAGKGFMSEEIDFCDGNSDKNEYSNEDEDFNEDPNDPNEEEQQVFDIVPNSELYIDDEETENHLSRRSELPREAEAGPETDTVAISEGFTPQASIEETEGIPLTTGTIGELETQVENIDFVTHDLALTEGTHRNSRYNLRPRRERDYSHLHVILESLVMTQYPMHKGIKVFGDAGTAAVLEELQQLHARV